MNDIIPENIKSILITGGSGFIGGTLVRRLLLNSAIKVYNLDKCSYCSDNNSINILLDNLGEKERNRYKLLKVDLINKVEVIEVISNLKPDIVIHLAAESHVDRSIDRPDTFIDSNIVGTFNLLNAVRDYWEKLPIARQKVFRFHHISTDEVFGSLGDSGSFDEDSPYFPRSPYSASKAASDHLVNAWHHTYGLPTIITNCSNNFGPRQFPEKIIPLSIRKALNRETIPLYGDGKNVRDWLFVEDHIDGILLAVFKGRVGESYCIGGTGEKTNLELLNTICKLLDRLRPVEFKYAQLINMVKDRPGHDFRYSINPRKIQTELGWKPNHSFDEAIEQTVVWYINNQSWTEAMLTKASYDASRLGRK